MYKLYASYQLSWWQTPTLDTPQQHTQNKCVNQLCFTVLNHHKGVQNLKIDFYYYNANTEHESHTNANNIIQTILT